MTVDEFYNFIVSQMSPEEALKKLLSTQVAMYKQQKEEEPDSSKSPYFMIIAAAKDLGWTICIEKGEEKLIRGISIGTPEYLKEVVKA
jgi:hypothetical protein